MIGPFVDVDWLRGQRGEVVVCDVRWMLPGGADRSAYEEGHVPGAHFVDLDQVLASAASDHAGRHPLPDPGHFAAAMSGLGICDETPVVAYDAAGGIFAARLVWMLRVLGEPASLLSGGLAAWPSDSLEEGPDRGALVPEEGACFTPRPWPADRIADIDEVAAAAVDGDAVVIDARPADRFRGEGAPGLDPRPGHIPGARSLPAQEHLGADRELVDAGELRERFAAAGVDGRTPFISSCGSGISACFNLLVAESLGLGLGRLYVGSWSQYAADPTRPVATGD